MEERPMSLIDRPEQATGVPADASTSNLFSDAYGKIVTAIREHTPDAMVGVATGAAGIALGAAALYFTRGRVLARAMGAAEDGTFGAALLNGGRSATTDLGEGYLACLPKTITTGTLPAKTDIGADALSGKLFKESIKEESEISSERVNQVMADQNNAELRKSLHLPADASSERVNQVMADQNNAELRKSLRLPADASSERVNQVMADQNNAELRKSLHLPADASSERVNQVMANQNNAELRKSLHLPADAISARVYQVMADQNNAELRKLLYLQTGLYFR
jgi:hypothetical protein